MRRFLPLVALVFALSATPASARDAGVLTCSAPLGPGGQMMEVTLSAEAGGCPGPGEAIPARWLIGTPRPVGAAPSHRKPLVETAPAPAAAQVQAAPASAPATPAGFTSTDAPQVSTAAMAAAERAGAASRAVLASMSAAQATPPVTAATADHGALPQPALAGPGQGWLLIGLALLAAVALVARRPARRAVGATA